MSKFKFPLRSSSALSYTPYLVLIGMALLFVPSLIPTSVPQSKMVMIIVSLLYLMSLVMLVVGFILIVPVYLFWIYTSYRNIYLYQPPTHFRPFIVTILSITPYLSYIILPVVYFEIWFKSHKETKDPWHIRYYQRVSVITFIVSMLYLLLPMAMSLPKFLFGSLYSILLALNAVTMIFQFTLPKIITREYKKYIDSLDTLSG
ncbi:MAG: hypothetical protein CMF42_03750 [Legionellales bacterium]|nr:hypothetical protein [Legionellales bacterium]